MCFHHLTSWVSKAGTNEKSGSKDQRVPERLLTDFRIVIDSFMKQLQQEKKEKKGTCDSINWVR